MNRIINYLILARSYVIFNLKANLAYKSAFISQVFAMFFNDLVWVIFWSLFFTRFPTINGWGVEEVITVWAIAAAGLGLAYTIFGNITQLSTLIPQGGLDVWLLYPRSVLPHLLLGRMSVVAIGDALFGFAVYIFYIHPSIEKLLLFTFLVLTSAIVFLGFGIICGSLGFFIGNARIIDEQLRFSLITFSTYPSSLFQGAFKIILFTLIPAAFINALPVEVLRELSVFKCFLILFGSFVFVFIGFVIFYYGIRRYESGNLTEMRG